MSILFSILGENTLKRLSEPFSNIGEGLSAGFPAVREDLTYLDYKVNARDYFSISFLSMIAWFILFAAAIVVLWFLGIKELVFEIFLAFILLVIIFFRSIGYVKLLRKRKEKNIENNVLPALREMIVQLNSGLTLFKILENTSKSGFGELSAEIGKAVKKINGGEKEVKVLERLAAVNKTKFFRKFLWQVINGLKSGADMKMIIGSLADELSSEQLLQIQEYGSRLNPMAMLYMLSAVIIPALGTTFMIMLGSLMGIDESTTKFMFLGLLLVVLLLQLTFIGVIKSRRPILLGSE